MKGRSMTDARYDEIRRRIQRKSRSLAARLSVNAEQFQEAHDRYDREAVDIRAQLASLVIASRLLENERHDTSTRW
jgi:hypothetical protein